MSQDKKTNMIYPRISRTLMDHNNFSVHLKWSNRAIPQSILSCRDKLQPVIY